MFYKAVQFGISLYGKNKDLGCPRTEQNIENARQEQKHGEKHDEDLHFYSSTNIKSRRMKWAKDVAYKV
jgi:hypothetical protein